MTELKLVPTEPTGAMLDRAVAFALNVSISSEYGWTDYMRDRWARMISDAASVPEGCTPADAQKLREANHRLADENRELRVDAARYRAWRRVAVTNDTRFARRMRLALPEEARTGIPRWPTEAEWDAAIDAARAEGNRSPIDGNQIGGAE